MLPLAMRRPSRAPARDRFSLFFSDGFRHTATSIKSPPFYFLPRSPVVHANTFFQSLDITKHSWTIYIAFICLISAPHLQKGEHTQLLLFAFCFDVFITIIPLWSRSIFNFWGFALALARSHLLCGLEGNQPSVELSQIGLFAQASCCIFMGVRWCGEGKGERRACVRPRVGIGGWDWGFCGRFVPPCLPVGGRWLAGWEWMHGRDEGSGWGWCIIARRFCCLSVSKQDRKQAHKQAHKRFGLFDGDDGGWWC